MTLFLYFPVISLQWCEMTEITFHKKVRTLLNLKFKNFKLDGNIVSFDNLLDYFRFFEEFKEFNVHRFYEWRDNIDMPDIDIILMTTGRIPYYEIKEFIDKEEFFIVYLE